MKKTLTQLIDARHKAADKIMAYLSAKRFSGKEIKRLKERYHHFDDLIKIKLKEIKK